MAETLDWMFELDGDTSGADRLLNTLDRLDKTMAELNGATRGVDKATRVAGDGHKKHAREAAGLGGALDRVLHKGMEPFLAKAKEIAEFEFIRQGAEKLIEFPGRLAEGMRDLGAEMIKAGAEAERTSKVFENLYGKKLGQETEEHIAKIAPKTEFTEDRLKRGALDLSKVGFKEDGLGRAISAATDMAALSGGGEAGLSDALASLERVKRTGAVSERALGGLGLNQNDYFGELAKRTGKSADWLKKEIDKGTFDTEEALETLYAMITRKTGKDLGGAGVAMSKLMGAKVTHLGEAPGQILERAKESDGWKRLTDSVGRLAEQFGPEGVMGKQLSDGVIVLFDRLAPLIDKLPDQIDRLSHSFDGMGKILNVTVQAGERMVDVLTTMASFAGKVAGVPKAAAPDKAILGPTPGGTIDRIMHAPDAASNWIAKKLFGIGDDAATGLADGLTAGGQAASAGEDLGGAAEKGVRDKLQIHSPSVVFEDIGAMTALGFAKGVKGGRPDVAGAFDDAIKLPPSGGLPSRMSGAAAPVSVHMGGVTVSIEVTSSGNAAVDAEELSARLQAILPSAFASAMEQAAAEAGAGGDE